MAHDGHDRPRKAARLHPPIAPTVPLPYFRATSFFPVNVHPPQVMTHASFVKQLEERNSCNGTVTVRIRKRMLVALPFLAPPIAPVDRPIRASACTHTAAG